MHLQSRASFPLTISLGFLCACMVTPAIAQTTIYADTFSRSGTLVGSAPDTRPGSETWAGSTGFSTNNTVAYAPNINVYTPLDWLPLSITAGVTYSASVTVNMAANGNYTGGGDWAALGFGTFATTGADMVASGGPWWLLQNNGGAQFFRIGSTTVLTKPSGTYNTSSTLRLDFTRSADGSAVASYYINGSLVTTYNYTTAPTVTGIGFQTYYQPTTTTFDDFNVTATDIPEPSTYAALAGLAALGLAVLRRRNSRVN